MSDASLEAAEQPITPSIKLAAAFAASVILAGLADTFFLRHAIGWTAGLFYLIMLFVAALLKPARLKEWGGKLLFLLNIGLAVSFIEEPSLLSLCLSIALLAAFLLQAWNANLKQQGKLRSLFVAIPDACSCGAAEGEALIFKCRSRIQVANLLETLKNILLPLVFAVGFAVLLAPRYFENRLLDHRLAGLFVGITPPRNAFKSRRDHNCCERKPWTNPSDFV